MFSVIAGDKWLRWCQERQLDIGAARFAIETCYYGDGLRSRPGTLLINDSHIIHFSYSFWDTIWAMFEPSIEITIPILQVKVVRRSQLSPLINMLHIQPVAYFQVEMADSVTHHLILQRESTEFVEALSTLGICVE